MDGWVQDESSCAVLPLACHQYSIHCESSHVAYGAAYGICRPKGVKSKHNETTLCLHTNVSVERFTNTNRHTIQVGRLHEVGETAGSLMKQGTK